MKDKPKNLSDAISALEEGAPDEPVAQTSTPEGDSASFGWTQLEQMWQAAKPQVDELQKRVTTEAGNLKTEAEAQLKKNPVAALAIAGVVGLALGFLLGQKRKSD